MGFSQKFEPIEVSYEPRIVRKKIWVDNEWRDQVRYQIQIIGPKADQRMAWLTATFGDKGWWWSGWGTLTMNEDVYMMYKLRWE